jgi:hypothetical protein
MVTPIEVIDTAVKIELGALISGLAAYWVAKTNQDKIADKERARRRRDLLEIVAGQIGVFNQKALKYWAFIVNWMKFTPPTAPINDVTLAELTKLRSQLSDSYKDLISAKAKLSLLGETQCQISLGEFGNHVRIFWDEFIPERKITIQELLKYKEELDAMREAFFIELSNVYQRVE